MKKPDWKKAEDYEYTQLLDAKGWAWEFLRRNPEYRKDYRALCSGEYKESGYEPAKLTGETDNQWRGRCIHDEDVDPIKITPEQNLARKWGLYSSLYDPVKTAPELAGDDPPLRFDVDVRPIFIRKFDDLNDLPVDVETGEETVIRQDRLVTVFDLTGPVGPQVAEMEERFNRDKRILSKKVAEGGGSKRPKVTAFLRGVRALDALDEGASPHAIGEVLSTGGSDDIDVKAHDYIKSAIRNRDYNYRAIARRLKPLPET